MKRILIGITLIITNILVAEVYSQNFTNQQGGHCFTLEIPDYLAKTYQLNDDASLQYMNTLKEAYVIVIEDSKDHLSEVGTKFIDSEDFLINFIKDYQIESDNRKVSKTKRFEQNDYGHSQVEMTWDNEGNKFYMLITSVESPEHFYKILCWTLFENKKMLKDDFIRISQSLNE